MRILFYSGVLCNILPVENLHRAHFVDGDHKNVFFSGFQCAMHYYPVINLIYPEAYVMCVCVFFVGFVGLSECVCV